MSQIAEPLTALFDIAERLADPNCLAETAVYRARYALHHGQFEQVRQIAQQGVGWAKEGAALRLEAELQQVTAASYTQQGEYEIAKKNIKLALALHQKNSDKRGQAQALGLLSTPHRHRGQHQKAVSLLREALKLSRQLADTFTESRLLSQLGATLWEFGQYEEVQQVAEEGLRVCREIGDRAIEARQINNLAGVAMHKLDYKGAIQFYQQALAIVAEQNQASGIAVYSNNIGGAYIGLGEAVTALPFLTTAASVAKQARLPHLEALAYYTTGHAHRENRHYEEAKIAFEKALAIREKLGEKVQILFALIQLTHTCIDLEALPEATTYFASAQTAFNQLQSQIPPYAHQMFYFVAYLFYRMGEDVPAAKTNIQKAYQALQDRLATVDEAGQQRILQDQSSQRLLQARNALMN